MSGYRGGALALNAGSGQFGAKFLSMRDLESLSQGHWWGGSPSHEDNWICVNPYKISRDFISAKKGRVSLIEIVSS